MKKVPLNSYLTEIISVNVWIRVWPHRTLLAIVSGEKGPLHFILLMISESFPCCEKFMESLLSFWNYRKVLHNHKVGSALSLHTISRGVKYHTKKGSQTQQQSQWLMNSGLQAGCVQGISVSFFRFRYSLKITDTHSPKMTQRALGFHSESRKCAFTLALAHPSSGMWL